MIEQEPSVRLSKGEKVLKSDLCAQAKRLGTGLEFRGDFVGQHILPFEGEDLLVWLIKDKKII